MKDTKLFLSVIIPCYNEEKNLEKEVLQTIRQYLAKQAFSWEVIISDDGSTDNSTAIVKAQIKGWSNFRLIENPHGGKPSALMYGIKASHGKYVLFSDMDQSTPINQLDKLVPHIQNNIQVVIGSRGLLRKNFPAYRKLGSFVFATFRKFFLLREIDDTQCGFKLFDKQVVTKAFPKLEFFKHKTRLVGWKVTSYDVELLHIIKKNGIAIAEVPVLWEDADVSSSKGGGLVRYFRESKEMLTQIFRVKWNDLRGLYD